MPALDLQGLVLQPLGRVRRMHRESVVNSQEEPVFSLLGKPSAPVHKIIEGILVPVIIICQ